ncbi:MAG: M48 family metalloprotease [Bryobacteraceae bacterium]
MLRRLLLIAMLSLPLSAQTAAPRMPEAQGVRPETQTTMSEAQAARPEAQSTMPETQAARPDAQSIRPEVPAVRPEAPVVRPEARFARPGMSASRTEASSARPEAQPEAQSTRPEAQSTRPEEQAARPVRTYTLTPEQLQKAIDYARARNWAHFIGVAYGIAMLLLILAAQVAPRIRTWAEGVSRVRFLQAYLFAPLLLLVADVAGLPLDLYQQHLSLEYQQSVQGWGSWFWDWTKGELLEFLLAGFLVWLFYAAIRRSPRRWWFYFWLILTPIEIFLIFIEPVVIEPMFFQFQPLAARQPALVAEIGKVVARGGLTIPPERMYEMKASEKLKSLNAYVAGIGASKRVVVWDTTIRKMTAGEILFVFGHEMGHYVLGHIRLKLAMVCGVNLLFLFLGYHSARWLLARWGARWSIRGMHDWASLPVMLLALAVFSFASEPVLNSFSRVLEHNADQYGLEVIHGIVPDSPQAAAAAFQILGEVALSDPNPNGFIKFWLYDHPPVGDRVRFAAEYDPWSGGRSPKYVK